MTTDNLFLSSFGDVTQNALMHNLHLTHADEHNHLDIKHSSYYDSDQFLKLARTQTNDFSMLTTNIKSLNSRYDKLIVYIEELRKINFKYSVICLQETWLSENDDLSPFQIEGYNCVSQVKSCSNKGGLILYKDNTFTFETKMNFNMYQHWEGTTVKHSGNGLPNPLKIFNLYRPPRSNQILKQFIEELTPIIDTMMSQHHNIALVGDTNGNHFVSGFFLIRRRQGVGFFLTKMRCCKINRQ